MEIASNKGVIADASTPAGRAGMSESEWRENLHNQDFEITEMDKNFLLN